jgi:hypothetical protein
MFVRQQRVCAMQFIRELLRFVNQYRQTLRTDIDLGITRQDWH